MELKNQHLHAQLYKRLYKKLFSFKQSLSGVNLFPIERFYRLLFSPFQTFVMGLFFFFIISQPPPLLNPLLQKTYFAVHFTNTKISFESIDDFI